MSTTDYLETLSYDQLSHLRDQAGEMMRAIREEQKELVWFVSDEGMNCGWFKKADYLKAVEFLSLTAAKRWERADKDNPTARYELNLSIEGRRVPRSEYIELFGEDA